MSTCPLTLGRSVDQSDAEKVNMRSPGSIGTLVGQGSSRSVPTRNRGLQVGAIGGDEGVAEWGAPVQDVTSGAASGDDACLEQDAQVVAHRSHRQV